MAYLKKQIDAYAAGFFQLDSHMLSNGEYFCFSSSNYRRLRHLKMLYEVSNLYFSKGDYLEFVIKPFGVEIRVEENLDQRSKRLLFCFKASGYSLWARPYEENIEISTE